MTTSLWEWKIWIQTYQTLHKSWPCVTFCLREGVAQYIYGLNYTTTFLLLELMLSKMHTTTPRFELGWSCLFPMMTTIYTLSAEGGEKEVHAFSKGINLKVNLISRQGFKLNYYVIVVHHISHYALRNFI